MQQQTMQDAAYAAPSWVSSQLSSTTNWCFLGFTFATMLPMLLAPVDSFGGAVKTMISFRPRHSVISSPSTALRSCISTFTLQLVSPCAKSCASRSLSPKLLTQKTATEGPILAVAFSLQER